MDQSKDELPAMSLPQHPTEASIPVAEAPGQGAASASLQQPLAPGPNPVNPVPIPAPAPSVPPPAPTPGWLPPTVPLLPTGGNHGQPSAATPLIPDVAEDTDLIEKEWVVKAKQIVEGTRQDPYEQTKQIGKFKAEYMKKRYNKTIGLTDD